MKLAICSDLHFDARTAGVSRFDDVARAFRIVADKAIENEVDVFACLGDAFDPDAGQEGYRALSIMGDCVSRLKRAGIESHFVAGNHDVFEQAVEPRTVLAPLRSMGAFVHETPGEIQIYSTKFLILPFTASWGAYDPRHEAEVFLKGLAKNERAIVFSHLNIEGIVPGSESEEYARGREVFFPSDVLCPLAKKHLLLSGHYHRRQVFKGIQVAGSLCRLTFGVDEEVEPGYLLIDF